VLVVLDPGLEPAGAPTSPAARLHPPAITLLLELAPGRADPVALEVTEESIARMVDVLYRIGGRELLDAFERELPRAAVPTSWPNAARRATDLAAGAVQKQRLVVLGALQAVDDAARRVLRNELDGAGAVLRLERYGLGRAAGQDVGVTEDGRETYRSLRTTVAQLDARRRQVRRWNFTIPANAPTARRQFEEDLAQYVNAFREAVMRWPALAACGAALLKEVGDERASDVQRWAAGDNEATVLDDLIKKALGNAWTEYVEERPDFERRLLEAGDAALRTALMNPTFRPEVVIGNGHPLWRHAFLIQAALEDLEWRPGDLGYAAATSALRSAGERATAEQERAERLQRLLGWASLGFTVLAFVPVVGQAALLAAIASSAALTFGETVEFLDARARRAAVGPLASRFGFEEPDAAGFVVGLLGLAADAGLPVLGKALNAVLRPAGRLLAASRAQAVLGLSEQALDIAALAVEANAAVLENEVQRLGLDRIERGAGQ
jgi:hypothetical protein